LNLFQTEKGTEMLHRPPRKVYLIAVVLGCLTTILTIGFGIAEAHADYARSEPAADAVIAMTPAEVRVWFNQELFRREGANTLEVFDVDDNRVDQQDARIDDDDRSLMLISLEPDLPPGVYTVQWQTLSSDDGHEGAGEFQFTVDSGAANDSLTQPAPAQERQPTSTPPPAQAEIETETETEPAATSSNSLPCLNALIVGLVGLVGINRRRQIASGSSGVQ
jgi:methionine-rich copper-binding protein CopC